MTPDPRSFARSAVSLSVLALAGCSSPAALPDRAAPPVVAASAAGAPVADFAPALRCMDQLLLDYGTRELVVAVDDPVKADPALQGTLTAALSEMARRSRVLRVVDAQAASAPQVLRPEYTLRGVASQLDHRSVSFDLRALAARDGTLVPGAGSGNAAVLSPKEGTGEIRKFGRAYALPAGTPDAQARRALAVLGTVETVGRLARVPYWRCLGGNDAEPEVAAEIRDWYDAMAARPQEIIEYFQRQLRQRGMYEGPADGGANTEFKEAVARYREALGLSREPKLSREFLKAYYAADHRALLARVAPASAPAAASASASASASPAAPDAGPHDGAVVAAAAPSPAPARPAPLALRVAAAGEGGALQRGEPVRLSVQPSRDAHVYCYLQDEQRRISRFFPNRFQRGSRVPAASGLQLPGVQRFEIRLNAKGVAETVACFATERDVLAELPAAVGAQDFAPLPVASLEQVKTAFGAVAAGGVLAQQSFELRAR